MGTTYKLQAQFPTTSKVPVRAYVSNKALTSNLATLTTAAVHGITQVGTIVVVQGVDSTFDGTYVVYTIPTTTTFTYVKVAANVSSTAVSPNAIATFIPVTSGLAISNKQVVNNVAFLTATSHGLSIGDYVAVTIGDSIYDTLQAQVIGIPSANIFCYTVATTTSASTAVSQGAFGKTTYTGTYTVPALTQGVSSTLYVANTSNSIQYYRIAAQLGGASLANQWIAYDVPISSNTTFAFTTGLALNAAEILYVQASSNLVIFTLDGSENT